MKQIDSALDAIKLGTKSTSKT